MALARIESADRIITGYATTSALDRSSDVVKAEGVQWESTVPTLFAHDHSKPVGKLLTADRVGEKWKVKVQLLPAGQSTVADETWAGVQFGAIPAFSIGFMPVEYSTNDKGGITYSKVRVHELSLVSVPCNQEAVLTAVSTAKAAAKPTNRPATAKSNAAEIKRLRQWRGLLFSTLCSTGLKPDQQAKLEKDIKDADTHACRIWPLASG